MQTVEIGGSMPKEWLDPTSLLNESKDKKFQIARFKRLEDWPATIPKEEPQKKWKLIIPSVKI